MYRPYLRPTRSSLAKTAEPLAVKDKLSHLTSVLTELKHDVQAEAECTQNLGIVERQHYTALQGQVQALKLAFTQLSDAMIEEVERVRVDSAEELRGAVGAVMKRVDTLTELVRQTKQESPAATKQDTLSPQVMEALRVLRDRQDLGSQEVKALREATAKRETEYSSHFERMQGLIHANSTHISTLTAKFSSLEASLSAAHHLPVTPPKEIAYLEERLNQNVSYFERQIKDLKSSLLSQPKVSKEELEAGITAKLTSRLSDFELRHSNKAEALSQTADTRAQEYLHRLDSLKQQVESVKDAAVHQENRHSTLNTEVLERLNYMNELLSTQRKELFSSLTTLEQAFARKHDTLTKAIYKIARETNVTNPISVY
jgi:hypothetical protein